jgi:hypothetical protein
MPLRVFERHRLSLPKAFCGAFSFMNAMTKYGLMSVGAVTKHKRAGRKFTGERNSCRICSGWDDASRFRVSCVPGWDLLGNARAPQLHGGPSSSTFSRLTEAEEKRISPAIPNT